MRMRRARLPVLLAALLLGTAAPGAAQAFGFIGAGATFPTGDYGEYADTGWLASLGVGLPVGPAGFVVGIEGFYGQNNHSDFEGDKTNPYGADLFGLYRLGAAGRVAPYVLGAVGILVHKYGSDTYEEDSSSEFLFSAGAGVDIPLNGPLSLYGEGRYFSAGDTGFFGILAGLTFGFGGS
jgi:hypothetical protein